MFKFLKKLKCLDRCANCDLKDKEIDRLSIRLSNLNQEFGTAEKEIAYWKKIALNFKKFHQ